MSNRFKFAASLSIAATFITTLFSTAGSHAAAQGINAPVASVATFISQPVVQPVSQTADDDNDEADAASLAELVAETDIPATLSNELECLAGAVFFEAKSESLAGQLAVARVIVARANSGRFPSSYCGVVYQPSQFSFVRGNAMPAIDRSSRAWHTAARIAVIADEGSWKSPVEGAMFFHAAHVSPRWGKTRMARVDSHIFYR
ncbi:MAG: cell wall hydrolase [Novosphingobium meiothermophilum]|uniref:cell wall hydrolase n=1 Tax=Novosphingobium TaxID=165696 RepID=UPI000D6EA99F|nr:MULTISPECIES: cell wall hydrolase [Novosphingobium]